MARGQRRREVVKDRPGTRWPPAGLLALASALFAASLLVSLLGLFSQ